MFDNNISNICNYLRSCIVTWVIVISLQSKAHKIFNGAALWICNSVECVWWFEQNLVQQTCRRGASFLSSNDLKILIYYISAERDWRSQRHRLGVSLQILAGSLVMYLAGERDQKVCSARLSSDSTRQPLCWHVWLECVHPNAVPQ